MSNPLLSIITVTFNDTQGLKSTLDSVNKIRGIEYEHIVVDSSPEQNQKTDFNKVKHVFDLPPKGVYSAQNRGLDESRGKLILFLNSGDTLKDPPLLKDMVQELVQNPSLDLIVAGIDRIRDGQFLYSSFPKNDFFANILGENKIPHMAVLYKKSVFTKVGKYSTQYKIASDYEHHIKCYLAKLNGKFIQKVLSQHDTSGISSQQYEKTLNELKSIHSWFQSQLPLIPRIQDRVYEKFENYRIHTIKKISTTSLGTFARPLWLWLKR